jgi:3-hydroxyisobutyrate dehydrogenase-like beta-hydroxyacid dehydrogenase
MAASRVAFLGLGAMGSRMARRLLESGVDVTVWNRAPERAEGFPARAATPEQAAEGADVAIVMVADGDAVEAVTAGLPRELTVVDMSTSGPDCALRLGERFDAACDAPVGGSLSEAESGTLAVYAGGEDQVVDRVEPLLARMGTVYRTGALGSGQAIKLAGNMLMLANTAALAEVLKMVHDNGIDPEVALQALAAGPGASRAITHKGPVMVRGDFGPPARFTLELAAKDAELANEMMHTPTSRLVAKTYRRALEMGLGEMDYSAVAALR